MNVLDWIAVTALEVRVGDVGAGREWGGWRPRGVQGGSFEVDVGVVVISWTLEGEV